MVKGKKLRYRELQARLHESADERRRLAAKLQAHLSQGFSVDSFPEVTRGTLKRLFELYPEEFDSDERELATLKGMLFWENVGKKQATGECLGNSQAWRFNMSARYGWTDKIDVTAKHSGAVAVEVVNYGAANGSSSVDG